MSAVEPSVQMDLGDARRLTERIRLIAGNVADNVEKLRSLVAEAKASNVHVVLGYASWTAYLQDVFGDEPLRLARDVRQELVAELAAQGMSTRAIAPIVGVDKDTVRRDLLGGANTPPVEVVPDLTVNPNTGEVYEAGDEDDRGEAVVVEHTLTEKTRTVTGLDGKNYKTPEKREQRRPSIIDSARTVGWELRKASERLERLKEDDRFTKNKAEIMAALQPHLDFVNETIASL